MTSSGTDKSAIQASKQQVARLLRHNRLREALPLLETICAGDESDLSSAQILGSVREQLGDLQGALSCFQAVCIGEPGNVQAAYNLGVTLQRLGRYVDAVPQYARCLELQADHVQACVNLAAALGAAGQLDEAVEAFYRAVRLQPAEPALYWRLALACEQLHRLDEAEQVLAKGLELAPRHIDMNIIMARLERRDGRLAQARERLERIGNPDAPPEQRAKLFAALGEVLDKQRDYVKAFRAFETAQAASAATPAAGKALAIPYLERLPDYYESFSADRVNAWPTSGCGDRRLPVMLVGHPRSGTTLAENILAAHPGLIASDERPFLRHTIGALGALGSEHVDYPACMDELDQSEVETVRNDYLRRCVDYTGEAGPRLVDKNPLNLVDLGFVRRVMPEAKVLVMLRDPRDVCLSCFFKVFRMNKAMVQFTSLEGTARHYAEVMKLWLHYRDALGLSYLETRYEDLVEDLESNARAWLAFLGEPWDDAVLNYHEHARKQYVSTPSYEGVKEGVYRKASGRWKHYEKQLEPVMEILQPYIDIFGYGGRS